ncbi:MAG: 3-isopropylmalate dehydrogenase [Gemmatimonadetes bacterium]|nr:MAG: 3-isopropylmalate dehydrogenase [Gemmatimonadetes bacterium 13_1_40CM_3_66_12]OLD87974.1 MAG: 3-isopropylmalate dehydrogenase [Gemmatimonadetes bacterium 13_1_20CM_4_66_11]PYP94557.1 MAG: 3-isopropylmalate dehydrogenase [Gemmatimonadota bacterium]
MKRYTIAVLPGDGIGPEVIAQAVRVLEAVGERFEIRFALDTCPVGAAAVRTSNSPLPPETRRAVTRSHAVLLGAVGDPTLDDAPRELRPETGLLTLRKLLDVYANLRPVAIHAALAGCSPLKPDRLRGVDLLVVRELTGGLYYGEPRGRNGKRAINTLAYTTAEIERIARVAFDAARGRRRLVTSVDKANVLEVSQLWRETVTQVGRAYPDVRLEHCYVDTAAMRLVSDPASLDVVLTENMFGDILSDEAAVLAGSLGLLPSASLGDGAGLFEPVHGSAPPLAGRDVANPVGAIATVALLLRHGLNLPAAADAVDDAIAAALDAGARTPDLARPGDQIIGTKEMGSRVVELVLAEALEGLS